MYQVIAVVQPVGDSEAPRKEVKIGRVYQSNAAAVDLVTLLNQHGPGEAVKPGLKVIEYQIRGTHGKTK